MPCKGLYESIGVTAFGRCRNGAVRGAVSQFYTMYFVSDSLRFEHARQIAEQQKAKEEKTHEEMRRKQENMEKRKENDVKTL